MLKNGYLIKRPRKSVSRLRLMSYLKKREEKRWKKKAS